VSASPLYGWCLKEHAATATPQLSFKGTQLPVDYLPAVTQVDVVLLEANFDISALLHMPHHPMEWHGEIDMLCVNPIFSHRARDLLSGAHRLLHKTALYYALPPAQAPPDTLHALVQVSLVWGSSRI
jgi:hypothetical protein